MYTAYLDDSTFILRNIPSVKELINSFTIFYHFSGLKSNIEKCKITGTGSLKEDTEAVYGLKCVDLYNDTIKILGIHFFYNKKVQMQNNFITTIKKIQHIFHFWNSHTLTLEGRIMIFKTLAISKIVYLAFIIKLPKVIVDKLLRTKKIGKTHVLK